MMEVQEIPLSNIKSDSKQPRKSFYDKELKLLSQNIKQMGLLQPITVRVVKNQHVIVLGERRFRACKLAKLKTIPCIIRDFDSSVINEVQIVENLQRKNIEIIEEAEAINLLIKKYTASEIAKQIGRTETYVHSRLKLAQLIKPFKNYVSSKELKLGIAIKLATLNTTIQQRIYDEMDGNFHEYKITGAIRNSVFSLDDAPFDINSKTLLPKAGACGLCPFNSLNNGNLFGDNKQVCTNTSCFTTKKDKGFIALIHKAKVNKTLLIGDYTKYRNDAESCILFASLLNENGLTPYNRDDVHLINLPIKPTLEVFKEDHDHMDWDDKELASNFNEQLEEFENELNDFNTAKSNGYTDAILINPDSYIQQHLIGNLKSKDVLTTTSKSVEKKKMSECTPAEKIIKIEQRAERKEAIEANREFEEIFGIISKSDYTNQTKALTKQEMSAFCISLFENAIGYLDKNKVKKFYPMIKKGSKIDIVTKFHETFDTSKFNQMARIFITDNVHFHESNHLNDFSNISFYNAVKPFCKKDIESIEKLYQTKKIERKEKIAKRIKEL